MLLGNISALQTDEYLNHISSLVYQDCQQTDIQLKENWFIRADSEGFVTNITWPYDLKYLQEAISYISQNEPYSTTSNMFMSGDITLNGKNYTRNNIGENILRCGENHLDVYNREYYWNTRKVDLPSNINNYAYNNQGNLIQAQTVCGNVKQSVEYTKLESSIDWYSGVSNLLISILGSLVFYYIIYPKSSKKKRLGPIIAIFVILLVTSFAIRYFLFK